MKPPNKPPKKRIDDDAADGEDGDRIAKVLARAGLCSRRDAERWIAEGRVAVNGEVLTTPAVNVGPKDRVTVDGEPLPERERTRLRAGGAVIRYPGTGTPRRNPRATLVLRLTQLMLGMRRTLRLGGVVRKRKR